MKDKGFTLMEMLGVIIVLAILAVITIPIMINIIEKTRKNAAKNTAINYLSGIEDYIQMSDLGNSKYSNAIEKGKVYQVSEINYEAIDDDVIKDKEIVESSNLDKILGNTIKGDKASEGIVSLDSKGKIVYAELIIKKYIVICTSDTNCNVNKAYKDRVKPKLTIKTNEIISTKDSITIPYTLITGTSGATVECLYGENEDNLNNKGVVDENNNKCELSNLKSDTTYYFKLTPTSGEGLVGKSVSGNTITQKGTISAILQKDGEKESDGKYYFDKDTTTNNIVLEDYCWLAINTDEEGNTRLIYNGEIKDGECTGEESSIGESKYSDDSTITNYNDSTVKTVVNEWYSEKLSESYREKISSINLITREEASTVGGGYIVSGRQYWTQTPSGGSITSTGSCMITSNSGGGCSSDSSGNVSSSAIYVVDTDGRIISNNNGTYEGEITGTCSYCSATSRCTYWSTGFCGACAGGTCVQNYYARSCSCCGWSTFSGSCTATEIGSSLAVRPVITLNNTLIIQDGIGTSTNPYILK